MSPMEIVYLVCFFLGLGFAILSGLFSGVFSGHAEAVGDLDFSGHSPDFADGGPHIHGPGGDVGFPAVSPVTISTFIATFGGMGIIMMKVIAPHQPFYLHLPVAIGAAFGMSTLVFYLFYKVFGRGYVSSAPSHAEIIGLEAKVDVTIPAEGVGQISYTYGGTNFTAPARANSNVEIKTGSRVKIAKIVGGTYFVEPMA